MISGAGRASAIFMLYGTILVSMAGFIDLADVLIFDRCVSGGDLTKSKALKDDDGDCLNNKILKGILFRHQNHFDREQVIFDDDVP